MALPIITAFAIALSQRSEQCFRLLASNPGLGAPVILYFGYAPNGEAPGGILTCRILHQSMLPGKHELEDS